MDRVRRCPCELNRGTLMFRQRGRFPEAGHCLFTARDSILLVIIITKATESKG